MKNRIKKHIERSIEAKQRILNDDVFLNELIRAIELCSNAVKQGKKILFAGNGGSASDAQHLAAELVGRYRYDRPSLAAIAITTDTSALTAIGNDYGYDEVFARQLQGLGQEGDVFVGLSTSGNSKNILKAVEVAREKGCHVIGMSGEQGALKDNADICFCVPASLTATVQEAHIMIGHMLCDGVEQTLFDQLPKD